MCRYKLATYWQTFTEMYLTWVKILQKVLGVGLLFWLTLYTHPVLPFHCCIVVRQAALSIVVSCCPQFSFSTCLSPGISFRGDALLYLRLRPFRPSSSHYCESTVVASSAPLWARPIALFQAPAGGVGCTFGSGRTTGLEIVSIRNWVVDRAPNWRGTGIPCGPATVAVDTKHCLRLRFYSIS